MVSGSYSEGFHMMDLLRVSAEGVSLGVDGTHLPRPRNCHNLRLRSLLVRPQSATAMNPRHLHPSASEVLTTHHLRREPSTPASPL